MDEQPRPAEPSPESESHQAHGLSWYIGWPLLLLLTYVLATGPAFRLARPNPTWGRYLRILYTPLIAVSEACPPVNRFLDWYVKDLWAANRPPVQYQHMDD